MVMTISDHCKNADQQLSWHTSVMIFACMEKEYLRIPVSIHNFQGIEASSHVVVPQASYSWVRNPMLACAHISQVE